jgi:hypothetical protein
MNDSVNDLVISAIKLPDSYGRTYGWEHFVTHVVSLESAGFQGTKVLLVQNIDTSIRDKFIEHGYTLIGFEEGEPFWTTRHNPLVSFLKDNYQRFRYLIWADVRDLVFQTNPITWLLNNLKEPNRIVAVSKGVSFTAQPINGLWLRQVVGEDKYSSMQHETVYSYGVTAGYADSMYSMFCSIKDTLYSSKENLIDQAVFNYVLRQEPFRGITFVPRYELGFASSLHCFLIPSTTLAPGHTRNEPMPVLSDGLIYPEGKDTPFSIVHHHDADARWLEAVQNRYKGITHDSGHASVPLLRQRRVFTR